MTVLVKKQRSVVGQTNRSGIDSPRRGAPPGGVHSIALLDSVKSLQCTMQTTTSSEGNTPRRGGDLNGLSSPRNVGVSGASSTSGTATGAASSVSLQRTSPRNGTSANSLERTESSVAKISDAARINGMRALLFDKFDSGSVKPPIPPPPVASTRFSSRTSTNTKLMVEAQEGTATYAAPTERFSASGSCHLDGLMAVNDKIAAAKVSAGRAEHARRLHLGQEQCIKDLAVKSLQQDRDRIHAKSVLQQQYEATRRMNSKDKDF